MVLFAQILDTDILSYYLKGDIDVDKRVKEHLKKSQALIISRITQYEILSGLEHKKATRQIKEFELFLLDCKILDLTENAVKIAAKEFGRLKRKGIIIGNSDILIAGIALSNNMKIATNNEKHFKNIEGLLIDNWKKN